MSVFAAIARRLFVVSAILLLAACGGGGGGAVSSPSAGDGFTVSATSLSFSAAQNGSLPTGQDIQTSFTNPEAYYVGAAYPPGVPPASWLTITTTGSGSAYTFHFSVNTTGLAPGTYSTTIGLGISRRDGSILAYRNVSVSYTVSLELAVSTTTVAFNGVFGSSAAIGNQTINISGTGLPWTASSDQPWVRLSSTSGTAPGALSVGVDTSALGVGLYAARITLSSSGYPDSTINITLNLARPVLYLSPAVVTLGGNTGRDFSTVPVQISLNTGSNAYSWSASSSSSWLQIGTTSGSASSSAATIHVGPNRSGLTGGTYTEVVSFTATVNGEVITASLPVTFNLDTHRILVPENGVALTSTPALSRLTGSVRVFDNMGLTTGWSASSDQPWLTVTPSGTTNDSLVLTANPAGLTPDTVHYATASLTSSDSTVENTEVVRVGLWVGSATPASTTTINMPYSELEADPIRPYVYLHNGSTNITVYNVYSGAVVTTVSSVGSQLGDMTIANDGSVLYVADYIAKAVVPINLDTGAVGSSWPIDQYVTIPRIAYARANGFRAILANDGRVYNAMNGAQTGTTFVTGAISGYQPLLAASLYGNRFCGLNSGLSPYTITCYSLDYASFGGGRPLVSAGKSGPWNVGSNGRDVALNADGTRAYVAAGAPYSFVVYDPTTTTTTMPVLQYLAANAYPTAIEIRPDGRIYGGAAVLYGPRDVWIYNPDGSLVADYYVSGYARWVLPRMVGVSGDGLRMITQTDDPRLQFTTVGP
jgi:Viral BACON domain